MADEVKPKPTEAEVAALLASAEAVRKKPSRSLWILALAVSVFCVIALAWGLVNYWDEPPKQTPVKPSTTAEGGSGFGLGLMIGIGAGIAIGSLIAVRRRQS